MCLASPGSLEPAMTKCRVLLVDDSADICELYRLMMNRTDDLECVGVRESADDLEADLQRTLADVAVIDLIGPGRNALEAIRSAAATNPRCRIIAFSGHDDEGTRDQVIQAGAWSLVSKHADVQELLDEIRRVRDA